MNCQLGRTHHIGKFPETNGGSVKDYKNQVDDFTKRKAKELLGSTTVLNKQLREEVQNKRIRTASDFNTTQNQKWDI